MNLLEKAHLQLVIADGEMANRREVKALLERHSETMKVVEKVMYQDLLEKLVPILRKSKQEGFNLKPYTETLAADAEIDLFDDLEGI